MNIIQNFIDLFRGKYEYSFVFKPFRDKKKFYNHIISLGYNCETAFRLYQYFKFEESSLFNWSGTYDIKDLIYALNHFEKIGQNDFTPLWGLWQCNNTKIAFHGYAVVDITPEETQKEDFLNNDKKQLLEKINYLKSKFLKILQDKSKKLYIYKVKISDISANLNDNIIKIKKALLNLGGQNFDLLVIIEQKYKSQLQKNDNYIIRTVKYYPPDDKVVSFKYNKNGFKKIFDEFWCVKPQQYQKNKVYKFEINNNKREKKKDNSFCSLNKELLKHILKAPISSKSRKWLDAKRMENETKNIRLIMTLVVKNEEDIIEQNIRFHKSMGVDGFVIVNHNSNDKTLEILENLQKEGFNIEILTKTEKAHKHHIWVNEMINIAKKKYKADWVINADADEFYFSNELDLKKSIYEYQKADVNALLIESTFVFGQETATLHNEYFEKPIYYTFDNDIHINRSFCFKVIHNTKDYISTTDGNHFVNMKNQKQVPCANITLYHYHIRNYDGYEKKVLRWIDSADLMAKHQGVHVKKMIDLYKCGKLKEDYENQYGQNALNQKLSCGTIIKDETMKNYLKLKGII